MFLLNVLGIIIGIAAIVALISIGNGLELYVTESLEDFGADKIMVIPGSFRGPATGSGGVSLSQSDEDMINKIRGVDQAIGIAYSQYPIKYKKELVTVYIAGVDAKKATNFFDNVGSFEIDTGRYFRAGESRVGVIGSMIATKAFDKPVKLGDSLVIKDYNIEAIGIMKSMGNSQDDSMVLLPLETYRTLFGASDEFSMIFVKATDEDKVKSVADDITKELDDEYGEDVFSAMTSEQIVEQVSGILGMITLVLGGIASIALVVAGVGIANTMLMSVMERTREIGIMKAIGATDYQVMEIFITESAMLGLIGGIIGVMLGSMMSAAIGLYGQTLSFALKPAVTPQLVVLALSFSVIVGIVSGLWPARKAAKLQPVEALRYE